MCERIKRRSKAVKAKNQPKINNKAHTHWEKEESTVHTYFFWYKNMKERPAFHSIPRWWWWFVRLSNRNCGIQTLVLTKAARLVRSHSRFNFLLPSFRRLYLSLFLSSWDDVHVFSSSGSCSAISAVCSNCIKNKNEKECNTCTHVLIFMYRVLWKNAYFRFHCDLEIKPMIITHEILLIR